MPLDYSQYGYTIQYFPNAHTMKSVFLDMSKIRLIFAYLGCNNLPQFVVLLYLFQITQRVDEFSRQRYVLNRHAKTILARLASRTRTIQMMYCLNNT